MKLTPAAIKAIQSRGVLLVYPIKNAKEPRSIWSELFPKSKMNWDWNYDADPRISEVWLLKESLSKSKKVVYAKWYQNRATFFSREVFVNLLAFLKSTENLSRESQNLLDCLESDSPLSTKQLKELTGLQGKFFETTYNRSMKVLWEKLEIVGFGEIEDSSFPSLAVGATKNLFEDLYLEAANIKPELAQKFLLEKLGADNKFYQYALKIKKKSAHA